MIARLRGILVERGDGEAIVDVQGVGYRVAVSLTSLAQLPETGGVVSLRVRTVVREDAFDLFGFLDAEEETLFLLMTSVSHVGPKLAMTVLSGLDVGALVAAIASGDVARLTKIHGVGKKTAERLVLELREKVKALAPSFARVAPAPATTRAAGEGLSADLVSALVNLGYKQAHAEEAASLVRERAPSAETLELQVREALRLLRSR